jgi:hypothetical protein
MITALKNGDFANATLMFERGREDVHGRVDITVMRNPAI